MVGCGPGSRWRPLDSARETREDRATEHLAAWTPWLILLALVLLAGYLARNRVGEHLAKLKANLRHDRTTRWIQTGDRLFEMREYEDAMTWYQRVVDVYPNSIEGWNSIAAGHQELGHHAQASHAYEKTHRMFTEGDATSLASAMLCAHRAGDTDRAIKLAQELATIDPELARHRLGEPRLAELRKKAGLSSLFRRKEPDGASYA